MQRPRLSLRAPKAPPRSLAAVVREHPETPGGHGVGGLIRRRRRRGANSGAGSGPGGAGPGRGHRHGGCGVLLGLWRGTAGPRRPPACPRERGLGRGSPTRLAAPLLAGTAWAVDTASCSDLVPRSSAACRASACRELPQRRDACRRRGASVGGGAVVRRRRWAAAWAARVAGVVGVPRASWRQ